jgi:hypothetical protein
MNRSALHAKHLRNRFIAAERIVLAIEAARKAGVQITLQDVENASAKTQALVADITGMLKPPSHATWSAVVEMLRRAEEDPFPQRHLRAV